MSYLFNKKYTYWLMGSLFSCMTLSVQANDTVKGNNPLSWPSQCATVHYSAEEKALTRLPDLTRQQVTQEQLQAIKKITEGPRGCIFGPFAVLLRSPELLNRVQALGEHIRFMSQLPLRIREFAILITGREIQAPYVWYIHEPIALRAGITLETAGFLAKQQHPPHLTEDERIVYDFLTELHHTHMVQDATYLAMQQRFGDAGIVELTALDSYFALLGQQLNVARTPVPEGVIIPFNPPWKA
ncbi:carboxymuconolactone decarboxylase family protein [Serratia plymuthica]